MQRVSAEIPYDSSGVMVRIVDYVPKDGTTPEERFEDLDALHRVIALAVALSPGPLVPKEIRRLRTELGLTCPDLGELIDTNAADTYVAEHDSEKGLRKEADIELRRLVFTHLEYRLPPLKDLDELYDASRPPSHCIRVMNDPSLGWMRAA